MHVAFDELLLAQSTVGTRMPEDLVPANGLPGYAMGVGIPFENAQREHAGCCNPQTRLALWRRCTWSRLRSVTSKFTPKMRFDLMAA